MNARSLWELADLYTPVAVRAAATLGIADHVAVGHDTTNALAKATGTRQDLLARLLAHLVTVGILDAPLADGRFGLTPLGQQLRADHPAGVREWLNLDGSVGRADLACVHLLHTLRTGEPAFDQQFGGPFWEDLATNAQRSAHFDMLMSHQLAHVAPAVAAAHDWSSLGHIVDVGGGDGTILRAILEQHPTLSGAVVDLAAPASAAEQSIVAQGLSDRAEAIVGSFFDPLPPRAGGYLLSAVLHDWDDDNALRILGHCADAARPDGRIFIIEGVDTAAGASVSTEMDLRMMTYFLGRERSVVAFEALAAQAGLSLETTTPAASRTILEFTT